MFVNERYFNFCSLIFILSFLSSIGTFCSNLTSTEDKDTPCFLEPPTKNPLILHSSGNSLVLPCHVARSKRATVEWWYTDLQKVINIKIYPVYPAVRPTVLRFITSLTPYSKSSNETDIIDASILLRYVNVDDTGIYRCVIRPWSMDPLEQIENILLNDESMESTLNYQVQLTGPRLCQSNPGILPCFAAMRTSSPTVVDAYQTAFLQCVVKNYNRPINVFWVVGNSSINNVLITDYLTTNQYKGDRLRRVFPLSPFDYSIELTVNRTTYERTYSCVIDGETDTETTLFIYIIHTIDLEQIGNKTLTEIRHGTKQISEGNVHSSREIDDDEESGEEIDLTEDEHETSTKI